MDPEFAGDSQFPLSQCIQPFFSMKCPKNVYSTVYYNTLITQSRNKPYTLCVGYTLSLMDSQKVKYLQPPDVHDFAEELSKILVTYGLSLTNAIMLEQARVLKEAKYPDLKKRGRRGEKDINLDFVRDILKSRGWEVRNILGRKRLHPPDMIAALDSQPSEYCKTTVEIIESETPPDAKRQKNETINEEVVKIEVFE